MENISNILREHKITLHFVQRNKKKGWTNVKGLNKFNLDDTELDNFSKYVKKKLGCNSTIMTDEPEKYLQFQGDQREGIKKILLEKKVIENANQIVIKGG